MGLKEELKDNSIIKKYRTQLIDSYVEQYGEKYRKLITENFAFIYQVIILYINN